MNDENVIVSLIRDKVDIFDIPNERSWDEKAIVNEIMRKNEE